MTRISRAGAVAPPTVNELSDAWFGTFLDSVPAHQTEAEIDFLHRQLPVPGFANVADVPCGGGRHARRLAQDGYRVTGADLSRQALARARVHRGPDLALVRADLRHLPLRARAFDAVICMWQSFGQFDPPTNRAVLAGFARVLRDGGRLVLDIYHRGFFERHQGTRDLERGDSVVREEKHVRDGRLTVTLQYPNGQRDRFEWELFLPEELVAAAAESGLEPLRACREFDEALAPSADSPRMQIVFHRAVRVETAEVSSER
jgi:SAM-dependent methyltransferase